MTYNPDNLASSYAAEPTVHDLGIPVLTKPAQEILSRTGELAVLPHVVFKVLELSGSADSAAAFLPLLY